MNNKTACYVFRDNINDENLQIRVVKAKSDKLSIYMTSPNWRCAGSCDLTDELLDLFKRREELEE